MKSSVLSIIFTTYFISINILFFDTRWSYASEDLKTEVNILQGVENELFYLEAGKRRM